MRLKYGALDALRADSGAFASAEARFLLNLVSRSQQLTERNELERSMEREISWNQLQQCDFALAYLWHQLRHVGDAIPSQFMDVCKAYSRKILMMNELRIHVVSQVAQAASKAGVGVVFTKGAAELCQFYSESTYLSRRSMGDLDVMCAAEDLPAIDQIMKKLGYHLSDYGSSFPNELALRAFSIEHTGHLMYTMVPEPITGCIEVHIAPAVGRDLLGYPPDFARNLLEQARTVRVGSTDVRIPTLEHMVVYNLCHAACAKDHWVLSAVDSTHFDRAFAVSSDSGIELTNARFDASQLEFLFRLRTMLTAMGYDLDREQVSQLLRSVQSRGLSTVYAELAQTFLPDLCAFLGPPQSMGAIARRRKDVLFRTSITQHPVVRKAKYKLHLADKLIRSSGRGTAQRYEWQVPQ